MLVDQAVKGPGFSVDHVSRLLRDSRIPECKSNQTTLACKVSQDRRCAHGCCTCGEIWEISFRILVVLRFVVPVGVENLQDSMTAPDLPGHR
ncbi:hypothetical protein IQ06DRAFT_62778 [Phaeosphaeriaceae sp. SRC1lsM3a]|nr:hypothetical protein IQ06DRAFT_62778 [Stagonospora sp. SRC1lsM3a]